MKIDDIILYFSFFFLAYCIYYLSFRSILLKIKFKRYKKKFAEENIKDKTLEISRFLELAHSKGTPLFHMLDLFNTKLENSTLSFVLVNVLEFRSSGRGINYWGELSIIIYSQNENNIKFFRNCHELELFFCRDQKALFGIKKEKKFLNKFNHIKEW